MGGVPGRLISAEMFLDSPTGRQAPRGVGPRFAAWLASRFWIRNRPGASPGLSRAPFAADSADGARFVFRSREEVS